MKRTIITALLTAILLLSGCTQTGTDINVSIFSKKINNNIGFDAFNDSSARLITDGGEKVVYWTPDGFGDLCVSLYLDNDTGIIKSSSIVFDCKKEQANAEFINIFQNTVTDNNKYIVTSEYETDKYYIIKFEDRRYREQSTLPTLKKHIDENDLY